jgi:hypothetical protein
MRSSVLFCAPDHLDVRRGDENGLLVVQCPGTWGHPIQVMVGWGSHSGCLRSPGATLGVDTD